MEKRTCRPHPHAAATATSLKATPRASRPLWCAQKTNMRGVGRAPCAAPLQHHPCRCSPRANQHKPHLFRFGVGLGCRPGGPQRLCGVTYYTTCECCAELLTPGCCCSPWQLRRCSPGWRLRTPPFYSEAMAARRVYVLGTPLRVTRRALRHVPRALAPLDRRSGGASTDPTPTPCVPRAGTCARCVRMCTHRGFFTHSVARG